MTQVTSSDLSNLDAIDLDEDSLVTLDDDEVELELDVLAQLADLADNSENAPHDVKEYEYEAALPESQGGPRQRKPVVPPEVITPDMTLFEYLELCTPPLTQKIIDIACAQSKVPYELWPEAAQEIRYRWATLKPDTVTYKPGQIAAYAHRMATNAALFLRRELGSPVRLPGSAFRKRKDGSSYVTPGVLARALDWEKLEGWFQSDGVDNIEPSEHNYSGSLGLNPLTDSGDLLVEENEETQLQNDRIEMLESSKDDLTPRQFDIMRELIDGQNFEEIMKKHGIKRGVLMREVAIISSVIDV